jgi:hypothetical protein
MDLLNQWLIDFMKEAITSIIGAFSDFFLASLDVLQTESALSPAAAFNSVLADAMRALSEALLPVASVLLSFQMCQEIMEMASEKNHMAEFDGSRIFMMVLRTGATVELVRNSFSICMAVYEAGGQLARSAILAGGGALGASIPAIGEELAAGIADDAGEALLCLVLAILAWVSSFAAVVVIYLVVWSRVAMMLIYTAAAPLPFATLLNRGWPGQIGQNYLKNVFSYALQGFLMSACVFAYGAILQAMEESILSQPPGMAISMLIGSMYACVVSLATSHKLAKSIFAAS